MAGSAPHPRSVIRTAVVWDSLLAALEVQAAKTGRPVEVVDLGGGTGGSAVRIAQLGHHVTVVDPSPDALASLERRAAEHGLRDRVRGVLGDAAGLLDVVAESSADLALCHGVLEVIDDPPQAIVNLRAVLRPAAAFSVLATQRHAAVLARALAGHLVEAQHLLADPAGRWGAGDPVPRRFTEGEIISMLETAGFRPQTVHGIRTFTDLVPSALVDVEPGAAESLLALERATTERPEFRTIATQLHVVAIRD
jgi:ubiquinone/menaquinone biosynthesis C-methylase UbiE